MKQLSKIIQHHKVRNFTSTAKAHGYNIVSIGKPNLYGNVKITYQAPRNNNV